MAVGGLAAGVPLAAQMPPLIHQMLPAALPIAATAANADLIRRLEERVSVNARELYRLQEEIAQLRGATHGTVTAGHPAAARLTNLLSATRARRPHRSAAIDPGVAGRH